MSKRLRLISNLLLLVTAFIWGMAFVAQSMAADKIGPWSFVFWRFLIGGIVLMPVTAFSQSPYLESQPFENSRNIKGAVAGGLACGFFLGLGSILQQIGLISTGVGKAGFITAIYIIIVPLLGLFLGKRPEMKIWIAALIAVTGFYFIAIKSGSGQKIELGDGLLLISSFMYSGQILCIDYFSPRTNPVLLSNIQFISAGLIGGIGMLLFEGIDIGALRAAIIPILYVGVFSSAIAYTLQIIGQRYTEPTVASLLMSMESVFSATAGWLILNQSLSLREMLGCALVFFAVILAQLPGREKRIEFQP